MFALRREKKQQNTFMKDVAMLEESFALVKSRSRLCYALQVAAASFYMEKAARNGFHGIIVSSNYSFCLEVNIG